MELLGKRHRCALVQLRTSRPSAVEHKLLDIVLDLRKRLHRHQKIVCPRRGRGRTLVRELVLRVVARTEGCQVRIVRWRNCYKRQQRNQLIDTELIITVGSIFYKAERTLKTLDVYLWRPSGCTEHSCKWEIMRRKHWLTGYNSILHMHHSQWRGQ